MTRDRSRAATNAARRLFGVALACATIASPAVASAQMASPRAQSGATSAARVDARWQPWIGCWQPVAPQHAAVSFGAHRGNGASMVCVVPASGSAGAAGSAVSVLTIANGKIAARDTIQATGLSVARSKDGCTGVENANWSSDGHRLYVSSDFTCAGGLKRTSSGLFAVSPRGEWVNIQGVSTGGSEGVRALHYRDAGISQAVPVEVSAQLQRNAATVAQARLAAGAPITTAALIEASHKVDSTVVEAWIMDRGQRFSVDAKQMVALADAGVPGNVTDALVALSYPKAFALSGPADGSGMPAIEPAQNGPAAIGSDAGYGFGRRNVEVMMSPSYSPYNYAPFGYSPYDYLGYGYAPSGYSPYGYSPYGSSLGFSPGYYAPYLGYGAAAYGGWYSPPVIVLRGTQAPVQRGYAVKGGGYTRTAPRGSFPGSSASPRPTYTPPSSVTSRPPPPPPPSQATGRTAHRRP